MASPQRPTSSTSSRYSGGADVAAQSGRSPSLLTAEKLAAALRSPAPPGTGPPQAQAHAQLPAQLPAQAPAPAPRRASSQSAASDDFDFGLTPPTRQQQHLAVSSPLNLSTATSTHSDTAAERRSLLRPPPPHALRRPQNKSTPDLPSHTARSPGSPLTLHDLGTDYTRYFNPFSDGARTPSRRSSFSEKRILLGATSPLATAHATNPFLTPNASTTKLNLLYDPEKNASFVDDRLAAPYDEKGVAAWPLIGDEAEADDEMHMPHPDDDIRYKPKMKDHFSRDSIVSTVGLFVMIFGLLFVFVALPVLSSVGIIDYNSSFGSPASINNPYKPQAWAAVNSKVYPFLKNMRTGLIDPDTPKAAMKKKGEFGDEYHLVFSDEFNDNNRTFYEGDDPYFYAGDFWYGATRDLAWYDPDAVTTYDGTLELRLDKFLNHGLNFRSGMLNSWNQLCFKGGIFEISASLPGPAGIPGLWPGAWTMGNLGRPGYLSTTDGMWPYTYQACDVGITPNQSSSDGLSNLPGQRLNSCTCPGEDHPTPGTGRGAPEIDIIEVGATWPPQNMPIATQSFQVAPFDIHWYPNYNYTAFPDFSLSFYNGYTGGPYQQAISATTNLNKKWYDGQQYQRYSFEYVPGEGKDAFISWKIGGQTMFMMDGRAIGPNGNVKARQISEEPMSLILNLGISEAWTWIDWEHLVFPAVMRIDYVRWYQKEGEEMVTCDPPGFETTEYIKKHKKAYTNANLTQWDQTGYKWPKHKLNSKC